MKTKIGIDLDNTIISYDELFFKHALKEKLIPKNFSKKREKIRNYIKRKISVLKWKKLQSLVYSKYLNEAKVQKGFIEFIKLISNRDFEYCIISHKTKYPYIGKKINLHKISKEWINKNINIKINKKKSIIKKIYFETTEAKKIQRIIKEKCNYFIDDLPSILNKLPSRINKILLDPKNTNNINLKYLKINKWKQISKIFF